MYMFIGRKTDPDFQKNLSIALKLSGENDAPCALCGQPTVSRGSYELLGKGDIPLHYNTLKEWEKAYLIFACCDGHQEDQNRTMELVRRKFTSIAN